MCATYWSELFYLCKFCIPFQVRSTLLHLCRLTVVSYVMIKVLPICDLLALCTILFLFYSYLLFQHWKALQWAQTLKSSSSSAHALHGRKRVAVLITLSSACESRWASCMGNDKSLYRNFTAICDTCIPRVYIYC